jgi:threonine dehydrogenase-like Zn-dependent dehydrogenase
VQALVFDGRVVRLREWPKPTPQPGEALVRVLYAGICNTDQEIMRGYSGFRGVLGHEFVGMVEDSPQSEQVGRRVVGEINAYCGECVNCLSGLPTHCSQRTVLGIRGRDGAFAEYLSLPAINLHFVPESIEDKAAVFTEPLAAALEITDQVHIRPSDRVLVLGAGKLGSLVALVMHLVGCDLCVVDRNGRNLAWLAERGIPASLTPPEGSLADVVVDCTGNPSGFQTARSLVRPRGTLVLKSTYHGMLEVNLSQLVVDEVTLVGSRCGPFPASLRLLERDLVEVLPLIDRLYPLSDGSAAMDYASEKGVRKVLLEITEN